MGQEEICRSPFLAQPGSFAVAERRSCRWAVMARAGELSPSARKLLQECQARSPAPNCDCNNAPR